MKNSIIAAVLSLISLIVLTDFNLFKTILWMPNFLWVLPLYLFFRLSVSYFMQAFSYNGKTIYKVGFAVFSVIVAVCLLKLGFQIFKINQGNILMELQDSFQITIKNVWFWILYQSYLILLFFSGFKQLVTIK